MKQKGKLADAQQGWVKLHRSTLDTPMMKNSKLFHIYGWALMRANHKTTWVSFPTGNGNKEIKVEKGQFIMGRKRASEFLGMPESTFYANIRKLQDYGVLSIESNNHFSIVTIMNTDSVDDHKSEDEQPAKSGKSKSKTTEEHPANTNNNDKNENNKTINKINNYENSSAVSINNNEPIQEQDSPEDYPFIEQAYSEFNDRLRKEFPNISSLPIQLTRTEFTTLMEIYDWQDISFKLDQLETWDGLSDQNRVYNILRTFLNNDKKISKIPDIKENSYYSDWEHQQGMLKKELEKQKAEQKLERKLKRQEKYFQRIKDSAFWQVDYSTYDENDRREIVVDYFSFRDTLRASEKLSNVFKVRDLTLEQYLDFRILDFNPEAICRFIADFENWNKINTSLSFHENYCEYLLERADQQH